MLDLYRRVAGIVTDLLRSRAALEAELLVLRQQINVYERGAEQNIACNAPLASSSRFPGLSGSLLSSPIKVSRNQLR